jgi:hypothetical protein
MRAANFHLKEVLFEAVKGVWVEFRMVPITTQVPVNGRTCLCMNNRYVEFASMKDRFIGMVPNFRTLSMAATYLDEVSVTLLAVVAWLPTAASEKVDHESLHRLPLLRSRPSPFSAFSSRLTAL